MGPDRGLTSAAEAAPYETLVAMIEHELELAGEGRFSELGRATDEREAAMAKLPDSPPAAALPALRHAQLINKRLEIELRRAREALLREASAIERARRAAQGYRPARNRRARFSASA
jgi:hypothetical protein